MVYEVSDDGVVPGVHLPLLESQHDAQIAEGQQGEWQQRRGQVLEDEHERLVDVMTNKVLLPNAAAV